MATEQHETAAEMKQLTASNHRIQLPKVSARSPSPLSASERESELSAQTEMEASSDLALHHMGTPVNVLRAPPSAAIDRAPMGGASMAAPLRTAAELVPYDTPLRLLHLEHGANFRITSRPLPRLLLPEPTRDLYPPRTRAQPRLQASHQSYRLLRLSRPAMPVSQALRPLPQQTVCIAGAEAVLPEPITVPPHADKPMFLTPRTAHAVLADQGPQLHLLMTPAPTAGGNSHASRQERGGSVEEQTKAALGSAISSPAPMVSVAHVGTSPPPQPTPTESESTPELPPATAAAMASEAPHSFVCVPILTPPFVPVPGLLDQPRAREFLSVMEIIDPASFVVPAHGRMQETFTCMGAPKGRVLSTTTATQGSLSTARTIVFSPGVSAAKPSASQPRISVSRVWQKARKSFECFASLARALLLFFLSF